MSSQSLTMSVSTKVVVVGCGISGIAAARRLVHSGFTEVRILEATGRSGGRIKTGRFGNSIIEIGANWIHGPSEENPVFCLARQYGLLDPEALSPENQAMDIKGHPHWLPNAFTSSGRRLNVEDVYAAQDMFVELMSDISDFHTGEGGEPCPSVGEFIRSEVPQRVAESWKDTDATTRSLRMSAISNLLKAECCVNGAHSLDEVGLSSYGLYKTLPGLDCTFPGGYEGLIKNLMSELPSDLVTYNKPVRCVHWNSSEPRENAVVVECDDGERITADHVIVTVPLGYLKKHHATLFHPPLPLHKIHSVQRLGFGTNNKIFVEFDSPWWDAECDAIYLLWEDEDVLEQQPDVHTSWIRKLFGFNVLKPTEKYGHVLCGWIAGHESEYMETLSELEVTRAITQLIRQFTGNPTITPKRTLRSQWFHDPWTCGSYSHPAIGCSAQDLENMMEPLPTKGSQSQPLQVLFAGEATHPCYFSTVHGALLTGWREADRLISHYSKSKL